MNGMNGNVLKTDNKSPSPDCGEEQKLISPTTPTTPMIVRITNPYSSLKYRSRYRPGPTRKLRRRAVLKNGDCNVLQSRISRRSLRFLQDIFTTLVDTQWRWTLLCFILSFLLSWLGFAVIWWLIAFTHGDFEERHLPPFQVENNWTPCVYNIFSFTSCFLFSIETQHTIGYGSRSTTEECPEAIFVMCIQSISGVMIQAFMVGIVFAKMTRPKQRTQTLLFSRNAVICQRDSELCLMFRVGDMRKSHIIGANVRAQMIRSKTTKEGEVLSQHQQELVVGTDGENGDLFFIWPTTIIHRINESSPFYNMSAEDMLTERFEIVLILEGTIESTGQTTQARSSYLPQEILWGHRFDPMVSYSKERQGYEVDYSLFNSTTQVDTPLCSGRELAEFYKVQDDFRHGTDVLIDEDRFGEQYCCNCRLINQQHSLPLTPLDCLNSYTNNKMENDYPWRYGCKYSNCAIHNSQREVIDQAKVFDFNPDAIQIIEDVELQQLPEPVNREIMKNSHEIIFEEKEENLEKNLIKLGGKNKNHIQEIVSEEEKEVLMPRAVKKNIINREKEKILTNSQEIIFEEEEEGIRMQTGLIKLNKNADKILKRNLSLKKIDFEEKKEEFLEKNIGMNKEKVGRLKNNQEINFKERGDFLETTLTGLNVKNANILKNSQKTEETEEVFEEKLDEGKVDILKNIDEIYEKEVLACTKIKENRKNNSHQINYTLYKPQRIHNKKYQLISLLDRDQQKLKTNYSFYEEQKSQKEFDRSLIDDSFIINDRRSIREPRENTINNTKNVTMEEDQKVLNKIKKYPIVSLDHSKDSLIFRQRSNYNLHKQESNNISIENEKIMRSSSHRPAKIAIQHKLDPSDICSPISPASNFSCESGFCEGSLDNSCRESCLFTINMKKIDKIMERESSNSSQSSLMQKSVINDVDNFKKYAKDQNVQKITLDNNIQDVDNKDGAFSYSDTSYINHTFNENNSVKCANASTVKEQIIYIDYEVQDDHEMKKKCKCSNTLLRKLVSNTDPKESSTIEKQFAKRTSEC
ncbi:uncharacterized protein LOC105249358 isoform X2 [Camponotus floridanus]|uniref:uncharacterized protein LOC105249358 isoform X2 n=1 Tax=Camponotus floridanus TaxID=104421 RepID=UPI00059C5531|nr:uncharacterized protein LOC105249358 isoform X2 [Camponotus floridanus]XP_019882519.1 uncharacterized protein LOC105249358 isoform X2 [Camponotus floridanus]XP_025269076.1 uncharacterized protein LOC105249358 isoform X2 [Camponotus floridanus]